MKFQLTAISNDQELDLAMERIKELIDSEPNTSDFEELKFVTDLVEKYESEHYSLDSIASVK